MLCTRLKLLSVAVVALLTSACGSPMPLARPPVERHTWLELRDLNVVKQQTDYSCGAAALATLLQFYFGDIISEQQLVTELNAGLSEKDLQRKQRVGYSLLDLRRVAQARGYDAEGFQLSLEQAGLLAGPVLVFVEPQGYKHFAVLRGMDRGKVYLADPARGNLRMTIERFQEEWHGIVFVVGKDNEAELGEYPLAVPRRPVLPVEVLSAVRMWTAAQLHAP